MRILRPLLFGLTLFAAAGPVDAEELTLGAGPIQAAPAPLPTPECLFRRPDPSAAEPPCVPAVLGAASPKIGRVARHLARAEAFALHRDFARAGTEIDAAWAAKPNDPAAWHMLARLKLTTGDTAAARVAIAHALELDPRAARAWATSAALRTDSTDALRDYATALRLEPTNTFALAGRAEVTCRFGTEAPCRAALQALAQASPDHPLASTFRLEDALLQGRNDDAIAELDRALEREPMSLLLLLRRAAVLRALGRHEPAVRDLTTVLGRPGEPVRFAIRGEPKAQAFFDRAQSLKELGRLDEAKGDIASALAEAPQGLVLKVQLFLRQKGYRDVPIDGRRSPSLDEAAAACMLNEACGRGLTTLT